MSAPTRGCGRPEALARLSQAHDYLDVAEIALSAAKYDPATSNAVLAGIAASDAICCQRLKHRAAGEGHDQATKLLGAVDRAAATTLGRLLGLKYRAQYDHRSVTESEARAAMRQARALVQKAGEILGAGQ